LVAALLNIEPDHMDRYLSQKDYLRAKLNIFKNQDSNDWALLNKGLNFDLKSIEAIKSEKVFFSGEFTNENYSAVYRIAEIFGVERLNCEAVFSKFKGLPHRFQFIRDIDGISFINDSKATNPASTIWALKSLESPAILLAGGKDKGLDYASVLKYLRQVKKINLFGQAAAKIKKELGEFSRIEIFACLKDASLASFKEASPGDTVLLSPMCASFDEFSNYKERGDSFVDLVNSL
jgi:UDP-N-acetylmuramoylalanine--D-glutamate ligase